MGIVSFTWSLVSFLVLLAQADDVSGSRHYKNSSLLKFDLYHPASGMPNLTRSEIIRKLVSKSHARVQWITQQHSKESGNKGTLANSSYESPLSADSGGYIMEIAFGTPPTTFRAAIDTGSDLVWVQSQPCVRETSYDYYGQPCSGPVFEPTSSSTYKNISCTISLCRELGGSGCESGSCSYNYQYESGGTSGLFAHETLTLTTTSGSSAKFSNFAVGCGEVNNAFGFEGLVGLGQGPISLTSQLASAIDNKFSYCLVDINNVNVTSSIYFGDVATLTGFGIQSTPLVHSTDYPSYYIVGVNALTVAGIPVSNSATTVFDSGTTLTYLSDDMYSSILSIFRSLIRLPTVDGGAEFDLCYDISGNVGYRFPELTINFAGGATLFPRSSNYFITLEDTYDYGEMACLAMGSAYNLPVNIIGNLMQQEYHILFDRGSSKLSFVNADCESL